MDGAEPEQKLELSTHNDGLSAADDDTLPPTKRRKCSPCKLLPCPQQPPFRHEPRRLCTLNPNVTALSLECGARTAKRLHRSLVPPEYLPYHNHPPSKCVLIRVKGSADIVVTIDPSFFELDFNGNFQVCPLFHHGGRQCPHGSHCNYNHKSGFLYEMPHVDEIIDTISANLPKMTQPHDMSVSFDFDQSIGLPVIEIFDNRLQECQNNWGVGNDFVVVGGESEVDKLPPVQDMISLRLKDLASMRDMFMARQDNVDLPPIKWWTPTHSFPSDDEFHMVNYLSMQYALFGITFALFGWDRDASPEVLSLLSVDPDEVPSIATEKEFAQQEYQLEHFGEQQSNAITPKDAKCDDNNGTAEEESSNGVYEMKLDLAGTSYQNESSGRKRVYDELSDNTGRWQDMFRLLKAETEAPFPHVWCAIEQSNGTYVDALSILNRRCPGQWLVSQSRSNRQSKSSLSQQPKSSSEVVETSNHFAALSSIGDEAVEEEEEEDQAMLDDDVQNNDENNSGAANMYLSPQQYRSKKNSRQAANAAKGGKKRNQRKQRHKVPVVGGDAVSASTDAKQNACEGNDWECLHCFGINNPSQSRCVKCRRGYKDGIGPGNRSMWKNRVELRASTEATSLSNGGSETKPMDDALSNNTATEEESSATLSNGVSEMKRVSSCNTDTEPPNTDEVLMAEPDEIHPSTEDAGISSSSAAMEEESLTTESSTTVDTNAEASANSKQSSNVEDAMDEDVPKESDPPVASPIIIDFDYISNSFKHDPRAKEIIENGYLDFSCSGNHERETFCRRFGKGLFEDNDIYLIKDGHPVKNHLDLSDVIFKVFQRYFDGNYISEATKRWNQSCEEPLPTDDDAAQEPLPTDGDTAQRNMNVSFIDVDNNGNNTGKFLATENKNQIIDTTVQCWYADWLRCFPDHSTPMNSALRNGRYSKTLSIYDDDDETRRECPPECKRNEHLELFSSDDDAAAFLDETYTITPSDAAQEAAGPAQAREAADGNEEGDDLPPARDRNYFKAGLYQQKKLLKGVSQPKQADKEKGCKQCNFDLVTEAALFTDVQFYILNNVQKVNFTSFDTFVRHLKAELEERSLSKEVDESINTVCLRIEEKITRNQNKMREVLACLRRLELPWSNDDEEDVEDGPEDDKSDESVGEGESDESVGEDKVPTCSTNTVFQAIYNNNNNSAYLRPEFTTKSPNEAVKKRTRKRLNRTLSRAYHEMYEVDPTNPLHIQTESGYVSSVHDHDNYDGLGVFEGKQEDIVRTKQEIAQRKRVAYQMRGLHIRLVHKKILAFELAKREFVGKLDKLEELGFWKWMESKRSGKQYKNLNCNFTDFKDRVEKDTGFKWSELADWGEDDWQKDINRAHRVGTLAYRICKRLAPGCSFCFRLISSYTHSGQQYGWHGDHTRDKVNDPCKIAQTGTIRDILNEMKKCQLRCNFCHDQGTTREWEVVSYHCHLDYPVGEKFKSAEDVFNMASFQALLWDLYVRGAFSGSHKFTPFSYETLEMVVWQHLGIAIEDLVTWPPVVWKKACKKQSTNRRQKMNYILLYIIKHLSGRCPNANCLLGDYDFANVSACHKSGIHMDHVWEGGEFEGEATNAATYGLVTFLNEICGYTWATCCFCHGITTQGGNEWSRYCDCETNQINVVAPPRPPKPPVDMN